MSTDTKTTNWERQHAYYREREHGYIQVRHKLRRKMTQKLDRLYRETVRAARMQVGTWLNKYAAENRMTIKEAVEAVHRFDVEEFAQHVRDLISKEELMPEEEQRLRLYNLKMRLSRMDLLQGEMDAILVRHNQKERNIILGYLTGESKDEVARQAGILNLPKEERAYLQNAGVRLLKDSFHSVHWSDRLWKYQERLRKDLFDGLRRMTYAGENPKAWASLFSKHLQDKIWSEGKHKKGVRFLTERLARTEASRIRTSVQQQALQRAGVSHVIIITEPDACEDCKKKDGEIIGVSQLSPGYNAPPFHPNCMCSLGAVDVEGEWEEAVRIAEKKLAEEPEGYETWSEEKKGRHKKNRKIALDVKGQIEARVGLDMAKILVQNIPELGYNNLTQAEYYRLFNAANPAISPKQWKHFTNYKEYYQEDRSVFLVDFERVDALFQKALTNKEVEFFVWRDHLYGRFSAPKMWMRIEEIHLGREEPHPFDEVKVHISFKKGRHYVPYTRNSRKNESS